MNSHSIEAAATMIVGNDTTAAVQWVQRRLQRGQFSGYKAARKWRMTDADIAAAIDSLRPTRTTPARIAADAPILLTSMTARSRRRLAVTS